MIEIGLWLTKYITIPLCIIGLVLCWAGRKGEKDGAKSKHKKPD